MLNIRLAFGTKVFNTIAAPCIVLSSLHGTTCQCFMHHCVPAPLLIEQLWHAALTMQLYIASSINMVVVCYQANCIMARDK